MLPQRVVDVDEDDVELELEDDDLVVVDADAPRAAPPALPARATQPVLPPAAAVAAPLPPPPAPSSRAAALTTVPLPTPLDIAVDFEPALEASIGPSSLPLDAPRPRLLTPVDHRVADDVAGECLASIAEVTARHRIPLSITPTTVPPPPLDVARRREAPDPDLFDTAVRIPRAKLPAVTAPPFVRSPAPPRSERASSVFSRGAAPSATSSAAVTVPTPASTADFARDNKASVAPVSMSALPAGTAGATVIVVHKPPRTAWIAAAAIGGALLAVLAMRAATSVDGGAGAKATANASAPPPPVTTQVVAPPAPEPPSSAAVVRFSEDQAVAIPSHPAAPTQPAVAPAPKPAAHPVVHAASPAKPAPKVPAPPRMPDGSYGLTRSEPTPARAPAPTVSIAAPAPPGKRALTPEQQLAEAQLKASMK